MIVLKEKWIKMKTLGDYHLPTKISREYEINEAMWVADLNTGERVYRQQIDGQDDSWKRLKAYLSENPHQYITGLYFRFRDHWEEVAKNKDIVFFTNHVSCFYGGNCMYGFTAGFLHENGKIKIIKYSIPELIVTGLPDGTFLDEYREISDPTIQAGLIWKNVDKTEQNR